MKKRKLSDENEILDVYEKGELKSISPSKAELNKYRQAARATFVKDRRVNIRLSSPDLMDIQARAAEEGVPYQTLIASVLHKFVSGRLVEKPSRLTLRSSGRAKSAARRSP
jgi:predicted DNA binding CopG/RHH family protein